MTLAGSEGYEKGEGGGGKGGKMISLGRDLEGRMPSFEAHIREKGN